MMEKEEALVKLSVGLITTLNHISKEDYLKIIQKFNKKDKEIFEKLYQTKKVSDYKNNKGLPCKTNYSLKTDYSELTETPFNNKKRYLAELISLNDLKEINELTESVALKSFKNLMALYKKDKIKNIKKIKGYKCLHSVAKFNNIWEVKSHKELQNLKIFKELKNDINYKQKISFDECLNLARIIKKYYVIGVTKDKGMNPTILGRPIQSISMVFQRFYSFPGDENRSEDYNSKKDFLPKNLATVPKRLNDSEIYYLKIPSNISKAFLTNSDNISYSLGFIGNSANELFFFKKESKSSEIAVIDNCLLDDFSAEIEGYIYPMFQPELNIWNEDIQCKEKNGNFYLHVPQKFIEVNDLDSVLLVKDFPLVPAYSISYDLFGNLLYSRIIYADRNTHSNQPFDIVFAEDFPKDLPSLKNVSINDLITYKERLEIMYEFNEKKLFELVNDYSDLINDILEQLAQPSLITERLLTIENKKLSMINESIEKLEMNQLELINDLSELANKLANGETRITQEESDLLKFVKINNKKNF